MGPRAFARGDNTAKGNRERIALQLQWGRELSPAEIAAHLLFCLTADARFNGAASFRPRRSGESNIDLVYGKPLQWGRELSPAEIDRLGISLTWSRQASMGPRAFARGDRALGGYGNAYEKLQWGRELSPAEIRRSASAATRSKRLQWGRELSPAEINSMPRTAAKPKPASMGPRAFARGDTGIESDGNGDVGTASMGPRAFARGDLKTQAGNSYGHRASMGPRAFARGDAVDGVEPGGVEIGFNGAASFRPRRCATRLAHHDGLRAASMGPRAFARGDAAEMDTATIDKWLQWGRELSPAEMRKAVTLSPRVRPRFNGAASFRPRRSVSMLWHPTLTESLQWGRELSPAEMRNGDACRFHQIRFNGAASFRPRRWRSLPDSLPPLALLQWGRELSPAEIKRDQPGE